MNPEPRPVFHSLGLRNLKSVKSADLRLRPLTVFVGENSAGKSSVLQAIYLLAQAVRARTDAETFPLNGLEFEAGDFNDLLHSGAPGERITITLSAPFDPESPWRRQGLPVPPEARPHPGRRNLGRPATWTLELENAQARGFAQIAAIEVSEQISGARVRLEHTDTGSELAELTERSRSLRLLRRRPPMRPGSHSHNARPSAFVGTYQRPADLDRDQQELIENIAAADVIDGFPAMLYKTTDDGEALSRTWLELALFASDISTSNLRENIARRARERSARRDSRPEEIDDEMEEVAQTARSIFPAFKEWVDLVDLEAGRAVSPRRVRPLDAQDVARVVRLEEFIVRVLARRLQAEREPLEVLEPMSVPLLEASQVFTDVLYRSVHYLGPLRQEPEHTYRPGHTGLVATLGKKGEYAAAVLHARKSQPTLCPMEDGRTKAMPLGEAVDYWLHWFGIASGVRTEYVGRHGIELSLVDPQTGESRHLTEVGVGASQILPVIVLCLLAAPGELILMEQPELHLHPAPQQILGDFLLGIARTGRQLMVETHSEYLINRLRLRVAEDDTNDTRELTQIWYGRRANGETSFDSLEPNQFGSFDSWPSGFFDQGPNEAELIVRAAAAKRRRAQARHSASE